ncbi:MULTISPECIES: hypothetical protein [unclassified Marinovum]
MTLFQPSGCADYAPFGTPLRLGHLFSQCNLEDSKGTLLIPSLHAQMLQIARRADDLI